MGRCATCSVDVARYGELGLTRYSLESDFNYMPINCMLIKDASELREQVRYMQDFNGIRIIYLDEISRLVNRGMDEVLLGPLEDLNYMWIASGSNLTGLDPAFLDRFPAKIKTKLPTIEILPTWLVRRCVASNIDFDPEAIILLAERSNYACRKALKPLVVLNAKLSSQRILTVKFVEEFEF
jgi:hypothetical protein